MLDVRRLLYPTDFSPAADAALDHATFLAERFGAELHLLHGLVMIPDDPYQAAHYLEKPEQALSEIEARANAALARLAADRPLTVVRNQQRGFHPSGVILDYAQAHDIDLIVMGTRGRTGFKHFVFGSIAEDVVRRADAPVVTIHPDPPPVRFERLLVPIDFSESSREQLRYARELAARFGGRLTLLHVIEPPVYPASFDPTWLPVSADGWKTLSTRAFETLSHFFAEGSGPNVEFEAKVVEGRAASAILEAAQAFDLVVVSTHGMGQLERVLLGSVAEEIVRLSPCPVFRVRPGGRSILGN